MFLFKPNKGEKAMIKFLTTLAKITTISIVAVVSQANANTVHIKNEDTANVNIVVEPGNGSMISNSTAVKQVIKPGGETTLSLKKDLMEDSEVFVVTGSVKMPSPNNKCGPLSIDKNYKIVFVSGKLGTVICTYQEVSK